MRLLITFFIAIIGTSSAQISFGPSQEISDAMAHGIAIAEATDMDGDGDLDMVAAESLGVRVLWWENDGTGNFGIRHEWMWGDLKADVIGLEDWNGDGLKDIWIEERRTFDDTPKPWTVKVAVNDGSGSFESPLTVGNLADEQTLFATPTLMVDLNGDGLRDILSASGIRYVRPGTILEISPFPLPLYGDWPLTWTQDPPSTFDMEGDGDLDLIVLAPLSKASLLLENLGEENYEAPVEILNVSPDGNEKILDIAVLSAPNGNTLCILENNEATEETSLTRYPITATGTLGSKNSILLPDAVDGKPIEWDLIRATSPHSLVATGYSDFPFITYFFEIDATNHPASIQLIHDSEGLAECRLLQLADLNGDLHKDMAIPLSEIESLSGSTRSRIDWLPAEPDGNGFASQARTIMGGLAHPEIFLAGDLDGSGVTQILMGSNCRRLYPPSGRDRLSLLSPSGFGSRWSETEILVNRDRFHLVDKVDLAGDFTIETSEIHCSKGRIDFLVETFEVFEQDGTYPPSGALRFAWLLQDNSGVFHLKEITAEVTRGLATALHFDWDGDSIRDLVYTPATPLGSQGHTFLRRGTGVTFARQEVLSSIVLHPSEARDMDWDGDLDLILRGFNNPLIGYPSAWAENDGAGTIASIRALPHSAVPVAADFDRDGHLDFFDSSFSGGVLLARPGLSFEPIGNLSGRGLGHLLDLDGDGDADQLLSYPTHTEGGYQRLFWQENLGEAHFTGSNLNPPGELIAPARWAMRNRPVLADVDGDGVSDLVVASTDPSRLEWFKITRVPESEAFTSWMVGSGLSGNSAGPSSDWDLDGVSNWEEFAFGSDAAAPDSHHLGRPRLDIGSSGLNYTFQRRIDASSLGVTYDMFRSEDLVTWNPWTPTETTETTGSDYERVRITVAPGRSSEFFKTRVSEPGEP